MAKAQNLVPDSSFESNKLTPTDFSSLNFSNSWRTASWGTSDLFCKCDRKQKKYSLVDVPQNPMGYQEAHSGACYAGIFAHSHGQYREYIQTPLKTPLEKNKTYLFTMHVSLADYSRVIVDQLGVCFLAARAGYESSNVITDLKPVYMNIEQEIGKEEKTWHRITAIYKAKGGEAHLLIGSFAIHKIVKTKVKAPKEIRSRINQTVERDAYYYIDDVSLVETISTDITDSFTEPIIKDSSFIFKNVLFKSNEALILASSYSELDLLLKYLEEYPQTHIEIVGHTDNTGNEKLNKKLSAQRARSVSDYLAEKGIDKDRISYTGYGSLKPIASNETEEGKQQNRRVEYIITKK
ncbi:MAG: OmpA family protein [Bacteroidota bacterium]